MKPTSSSLPRWRLALAAGAPILLCLACSSSADDSDPSIAAPAESVSTNAITAPAEVASVRPPYRETLVRTWHDPRPPPETVQQTAAH